MKTLIAEDDFTSRMVLQELLKGYGSTHIVVNGEEAVESVRLALEAGKRYDLICLDIMMPKMNGQQALQQIRSLEESHGIWSTHGAKILMTTALEDIKNVATAYNNLCDGYLTKPILKSKLIAELERLNLNKPD